MRKGRREEKEREHAESRSTAALCASSVAERQQM